MYRTRVGKLEVEVYDNPKPHRRTVRYSGSLMGPFWADPASGGMPVFCPRFNTGKATFYTTPPSETLLILLDHFHETPAVMPLLDKLVEEYPETQLLLDEVLS